MDTTAFNIPSISCSTCSGKIQEELKTLKGIGSINVDLKSQQVNIEYNPNEVTPADIKKKIVSMGYEVIQ